MGSKYFFDLVVHISEEHFTDLFPNIFIFLKLAISGKCVSLLVYCNIEVLANTIDNY